MLSKNKIKLIRSLDQKKQRLSNGLFLAEGDKLVRDLLPAFPCELLAARPEWLETHALPASVSTLEAAPEELKKASLLQSPPDVLALFRLPETAVREVSPHELLLLLDGVQDPGNLGTIVRIADWFGIDRVVCSRDSADVFNPKTVQATMGALARVPVQYADPVSVLENRPTGMPVYGTFLDGENLYGQELSAGGIIVLGSEGNGISEAVARQVTHRLYIPSYPPEAPTSESLNVAVAAAVVCAEFRRRLH